MEVLIEKLVVGGDGLARLDGQVIFIPYSAPGDRLEIRIVEKKKNYSRGEITKILQPSIYRTEPACPHFGYCGGCSLQHIHYDAQKEFKRAAAEETYRKIGNLNFENLPLEFAGSGYQYRNRIQLQKSEEGAIGFKAVASDSVIPLKACPVLVKSLEDRIVELSKTGKWEGREYFATGDKVFGPGEEAKAILGGKEVRFSAKLFFQSNLAMMNRVMEHAALLLRGNKLYDLYGGVGTFGAVIGGNFNEIVGVEASRDTKKYALTNLAGYPHNFFTSTLEKWVQKNKVKFSKNDWVILDPPRKGLSSKVRHFLKSTQPSHIFYLSCNPSTHARDLGELVEHGYALKDLRVFDFYPQTGHMEALAVLEK